MIIRPLESKQKTLIIAVVINMFRLLDFLTGEDIIRNSLKLL